MWNAIVPGKLGIAIYNFDGKVKHGLVFNIGDVIQIHEECLGWYRGCTSKNKSQLGIFPASHALLRTTRQASDGSVELVEDATVGEVGYVLREWNALRKRMFIEINNKKNAKFAVLGEIMLELINFRRALVSRALTAEQTKELKSKISKNIDWGNKLLGLDLVPRINEEPVDGYDMNPLELHQLHLRSTTTSKDITIRSKTLSRLKHTPQRLPSVCSHGSLSTATTFHVLLNLSCNVALLNHEILAHVRLYDMATFKPFAENFVIKITKNGKIVRLDGQPNCSVLFKDLGREDKERDAYLVVHAFRLGSLKEFESSKLPCPTFRRPLGCGAVRITDLLSDKVTGDESQSFNCRIHNCSEQDFAFYHEHLMKRDSGDSTQLDKMPGKSFSIFATFRTFGGDFYDLASKDPHIFRGVAVSNKLGFPDIMKPNTLRNDLYVNVLSCDVERSSKTSQRSIECRIVAVDREGNEIQDCLHVGSGVPPSSEYKSPVLYRNNFPKWNETMMLRLPVESFFDCHLRVEIRHCSQKNKLDKKFLGFSFLKLFASDGTTICDGVHNLIVYKCEESNLCSNGYVELPDVIAAQSRPAHLCYHVAEKEAFVLETLLCSTKLTQNVDIVRLLQWRSNPEDLEVVLENFMKVQGDEMARFLSDILDTLFEIFGHAPSHQQSLAFECLVQIFNTLEETKFESIRPVLAAYMASNFSSTLVFGSLISCLCQTMESVLSTDRNENGPASASSSPGSASKRIRSNARALAVNSFKVLDHLSRCIIQSWHLFLRADGDSGNSFSRDLSTLVDFFCRILSLSSEDLLEVQTTLLVNFPSVMLNLSQLLTYFDLASTLTSVINSLPPMSSIPPQVSKSKLKCLHVLSASSLFLVAEWRRKVIPLYASQLANHFINKQNLKLSTKILTNVLLIFHTDKNNNLPYANEMQVLLDNLMLPLMAALDADLSDDRGGPASCVVSMLSFFDEDAYEKFVMTRRSETSVKEMLAKIFMTLDNLMGSDIIPRDWFVARMNNSRTFLSTLRLTSTTLCDRFLKSSRFDAQLWESYLLVCVTFAVQPSLQLETFSGAKAQKIKSVYGDMRVIIAHQISSMWNSLGENQVHFIPRMIGPFLRATLVDEPELRATVLPIFFGMMECQQRILGNFQMVEDELINMLDVFLNEHKGDSDYKQLFEMIMMEKMKEVTGWREDGKNFVESVGQLLERLLDYRNMLENEENVDIKMLCTVNLLNFYKEEINRREMYIRYVYKLYDLHLACSNHVEAAFSLLLHARLLDWSDDLLPSSQMFSSQFSTQFQWNRKEELYFGIIDEFDKGKCWEYGVPLCEELVTVYRERVEYAKLSRILQTQSEFYQKILNTHRLQPSYFRVGFYGNGYPLYLRNKEFVYRGHECEKLSSFQSRMSSLFPEAVQWPGNTSATDDLALSPGMYIQINSVRPVAEISSRFLSSKVCESIRSFYKVNDVDVFILDRPYHKGEVDHNNEFMTLHMERSTLRTASKLPGILRWFQVESVDKVHFRPIEVAIDSMQKMNGELQCLVVEYSSNDGLNLSPLTMRLQGVVDAAVQGGVKKYQQAFFSEEFLVNNPQHADHVAQLQELLECQIQILDYALAIHGKLAPPEVLPLHRRLQELFLDMKGDLFRNSSAPRSASLSTNSSSSSSLSGIGTTANNRSSGLFNDSESAPAEQSIFKQKLRMGPRWYIDDPPLQTSSKIDMTLRASVLLNFKSTKKNSSAPLLRSDSIKKLATPCGAVFYDRPSSEVGIGKNTPALARSPAKPFDERSNHTVSSEASSSISSSAKTTSASSTASSSGVPPLLPPKRMSAHQPGGPRFKPPVALPKHPPPLPPGADNEIEDLS